jgi:ketosteroid isomerase-like protein
MLSLGGDTMKTALTAALAAILVGCAAVPAATAAPKDEAEIKALIERWRTAFQKKDVDGVMAIYGDGKDFVAYDIVPPLAYVGGPAYRKDYEEFFGAFDGPLGLEIKDPQVVAGDTVAYAYMLEHLTGTMKGGGKTDLWLRSTETYRKIGGKWVATHDHVSVPTDMASGKAVLDLKP